MLYDFKFDLLSCIAPFLSLFMQHKNKGSIDRRKLPLHPCLKLAKTIYWIRYEWKFFPRTTTASNKTWTITLI